MPTIPELQLPPPESWIEFERLCFDLFKRELDNPFLQRNGIEGEKQDGVDIFGNYKKEFVGLQCKNKKIYPQSKITTKEILNEIEKAKLFEPKLNRYFILTSTTRNNEIQKFVRLQSIASLESGCFEINIFFWEDITERLKNYPDLLNNYYPHLINFKTEKTDEELSIEAKTLDNTKLLLNEVDEIRKSIGILPTTLATTMSSNDLKDELDYAKQLIETYKPESALDYLFNLKDKKWDTSSNIAKYRILANIGFAKLNMNLFLEASNYFEEAFKYNSEDEKAMINLATAYFLREDTTNLDKITNKILTNNPNNKEAYVYLLMKSNIESDKFIKNIPEDIINTPELLNALSFKYRKENKYEKAINCLTKAVELDKSDKPDYKANLASLKLDIINDKEIIKRKINVNNELHDIINLLDKSISKVKNTEEIKYKYQWIANRGLAKKLIDDLPGAMQDFLLAIEFNPDDRISIRDIAIIEFEEEKNKGIKRLEGLVKSNDFVEDKILLSDFYRIDKKYDNSINILNKLENENIDILLKYDVYRILENVYEEMGKIETANEYNLKRLQMFPNDILSKVDYAKRHIKNNKIPLAKDILKDAIKNINERTTAIELKSLAETLYYNKIYDLSIKVFEKYVNIYEDTGDTRLLLKAYYNCQKWDKALLICLNLRLINDKDKSLLDLETFIYEQLGHIYKASEKYEEYLTKYKELDIMINLALLYFRIGLIEKLDNLLDNDIDIDIDIDNLSLEYKIELAHLYSLREKKNKFYKLLYNLRETHYNESKAHSAYMWLILERGDKDKELLNISQVDVDTVVTLKKDNEEKSYFIESSQKANLSKKELNPGLPLYKKLINLKIGDKVCLSENEFSKDVWEIKEIKSKYIFAFNESMSNFNELFPEDNSFQKIQFEKENIAEDIVKTFELMTKDVDKQRQELSKLISQYKTGNITIGFFAKLLKKNVIELWSMLVNDESVGLMNCIGSQNEANDAKKNIINLNHFVVDIITISTLFNIKFDLKILNGKYYFSTTQSVIDDIIQYKNEINSTKFENGFTIYKEGNQYYRQDIPKNIKEKQISYLEKLQEYVDENCRIIPINPETVAKTEHYKEIKKTIGISSTHSILLAKQLDTILFSDDLILRKLAKGEFKLNSIWCQVFLQKLVVEKIIKTTQYYEFVGHLANMNYKHTSIDANVILYNFKINNWSLNSSSFNLLKILNGYNSSDFSASVVATNLIYQVWSQIILDSKRKEIFFAIINNLLKGRSAERFLPIFKSSLSIKFNLVPIWLEEINDFIKAWQKTGSIII